MARILYLVHRFPYPPNKGDKVRSFNLLKKLESPKLKIRTIYNPFYKLADNLASCWMARHEMTRKEAKAFAAEAKLSLGEGADRGDDDALPLTGVSWDQAQLLVSWLTKQRKDGMIVALPLESEWEYAARAGTTTPYSFGNALDGKQANCDGWKYPFPADGTIDPGTSLGSTAVVGSYRPNDWKIYDMHGNVREWCQDAYPREYGAQRVLKGGYWNSAARSCRSGSRDHAIPNKAAEGAGIRLVLRSAGGE